MVVYANSYAVTTDGVRQLVSWSGATDLANLANKPVKLQFELVGLQVQLFSIEMGEQEPLW